MSEITYKVVERLFDNGYLYGYNLLGSDGTKREVSANLLKRMIKEEKAVIENATCVGNKLVGKDMRLRDLPSVFIHGTEIPLAPSKFSGLLTKKLKQLYGKDLQRSAIRLCVITTPATEEKGKYYVNIMFQDKKSKLLDKVSDTREMKEKYPFIKLGYDSDVLGPNEVNIGDAIPLVRKTCDYMNEIISVYYKKQHFRCDGQLDSNYIYEAVTKKRTDYVYIQGHVYMIIPLWITYMTEKHIDYIIDNIEISINYHRVRDVRRKIV